MSFPLAVGKLGILGVAKYSVATAATAVAPSVAKSVGVGGARPLGVAKHSATSVSESELTESSDEASSGEEATLRIAKYNMQDIIETVKIGGKWRHFLRKGCHNEWRPFST